MIRACILDECGGASVDWVTLTAGIILLGLMVTYSVMSDSAGYLMSEFDDLNKRYQADAAGVAAGHSTAEGATLNGDGSR